MKIHLIDGTYELFRCYYGAPSGRNDDGQEVGATRALAGSLCALMRDEASHAAIAFDTVIESFRNALFDGYKTGEGIDPLLWAQFPLAEECAAALGLTVWPMREFEADDALATATARWSGEAAIEQVVICSPDKDLAQCVRADHVVCLDRRRKTVLDEAGVVEKFGVPPASIPDYLALVGDSADGIPGLPRWGAKSAAAVLARYGELDAIPQDPAAWDIKVRGARALAGVLNEHRAAARLYRSLATLRTDVPLSETLDELEWRGADRGAWTRLCGKLGSKRLLDRPSKWQG